MVNPFPLFDIIKKKIKKIKNFLLNIDIIGDGERNKFMDECRERPERFEEKIKRQKLSTFPAEAGKKELHRKMRSFSSMLCASSL